MTNIEHYKDEVLGNWVGKDFCKEFAEPVILKYYSKKCRETSCSQCRFLQMAWVQEEYIEPEIDWSTVAVDTPILVSDNGRDWQNKHFAKYEDGKVYAWRDGKTSFTKSHGYSYCDWAYAKLVEV